MPHPPIWTTAARAESLEWAAAHHIGLVASGTVAQAKEVLGYYQQYAESDCGWTPTAANRGLAREFYIAPTKAEIDEQFETIFRRDNEDAYDRVFRHPRLEELQREKYSPRSYAYRTLGRAARGGRTMQGAEGGHYLIGDPDSLTEQILEQRKECDAGVLIIRPEMGHMSLDQVADRLELFAKEVFRRCRKPKESHPPHLSWWLRPQAPEGTRLPAARPTPLTLRSGSSIGSSCSENPALSRRTRFRC